MKDQSWGQRYAKSSLVVRLLELTRKADIPISHRMKLTDGTPATVHLNYHYVPDEPAREPAALDTTKRAIQTAYELCKARGIKFVVIFMPIKVRVLGKYVEFANEQDRDSFLPGGVADSEFDLGHELARFCGDLGCPFIDMTEALRRRAEQDNLFVFMTGRDTHLDVDGHKAVADSVDKWLRPNL